MEHESDEGAIPQRAVSGDGSNERILFFLAEVARRTVLSSNKLDNACRVTHDLAVLGRPAEVAFEADEAAVDAGRFQMALVLEIAAVAGERRGCDRIGSKGLCTITTVSFCPCHEQAQVAQVVADGRRAHVVTTGKIGGVGCKYGFGCGGEGRIGSAAGIHRLPLFRQRHYQTCVTRGFVVD